MRVIAAVLFLVFNSVASAQEVAEFKLVGSNSDYKVFDFDHPQESIPNFKLFGRVAQAISADSLSKPTDKIQILEVQLLYSIQFGAKGYLRKFNPEGWGLRRFFEGFSGGIIGVTLWFAIGVAERFVIFRRKQLEGKNHKQCHRCPTQNPLNTWYCGHCGSVLQEAALPASLHLSPYITLDRVRDSFRFLSRLSVTTGFIAGLVIFVVFFSVNKLLAFVALVMVSIISYSLMIVFGSISETIKIYLERK